MKRNLAPSSITCLMLTVGVAIAEPLDASSCAQLRDELGKLEREGARSSLARGPEWAKANLKLDQLGLVDRLLEVEAQFLFRCPQPKRTLDAATEAVLENGTGSDPASDEKPAAGEARPPRPTAAKKPSAQSKAAATPGDAAVAADGVTAKGASNKAPPKRATSKPKINDAFTPGPPTKPPEVQVKAAQPRAAAKPAQ